MIRVIKQESFDVSRYYYANYGASKWEGPVEAATIRWWVTEGHLPSTHHVLPEGPNAVPFAACYVPQEVVIPTVIPNVVVATQTPAASTPSAEPNYVGGFFALLGAGLTAWAGYEAYKYIKEDPEKRAIRRSAERLLEQGAEVYADLPGWRKPPTLNGHIPDVFAIARKQVIVEEYENEKSVERGHARSQHRAFEAYARSHRNVRYEQVIVEGGRGGH